jgi:hypothetical protein
MSEEAAVTEAAEPVEAPVAAEAQVAEPAQTSWLDSLNEEYRSNPQISRWDDPNEFAKSYLNQSKVIGADKVVKPSNSWSDDQYEEFYTAIGRPESPDMYENTLESRYNDEEISGLRQMAFEMGLHPRQFEKMAGYLANNADQSIDARNELLEKNAYEAEQALRQEYGQAFEQKKDLAQRTAKLVLGENNMDIFEAELPNGLLVGDHPAMVKMFIDLASRMGEDNVVGETTELVMTPQEAQRQINEYMRPGTAYTVSDHPEHAAAVAEVNRLFGFV